MAGKQGYGRSPELSLKSTYIFSSTFEGSSHLERPERRFFRNLHFWVGAGARIRNPGFRLRVWMFGWFWCVSDGPGHSRKVREGPGQKLKKVKKCKISRSVNDSRQISEV